MYSLRKIILWAAGSVIAFFLIESCASIGTPSGGPRDEDPPVFLYASPAQGAVEVTPTKAVLTFDELINVKDAFSKVVVSPPASQTPRVSSLGRRVTVEFRDTLLPNTTYTVDFSDAIVDNNEGNKLDNFIYSFSTGPVLDSLIISGMVLGAEDLEPAQGMYVGLHTNPADSAFKTMRFERIAKTDENGKFIIGGLAPGTYRIYALDDRDGNLFWSSPEESLAFYDFSITPQAEETVTTDTIYDLITGAVDTVTSRTRTRFLPNNILLRSFNTGFKQQYITKYERVDSTRINLIFNAPADTFPSLRLALPGNEFTEIAEVAVTERSATNDTISLWLKNRDFIANDTLRMAVEYLKADSVYAMQPVNDTLRFVTPKIKQTPSKTAKKKKDEAVDSLPPPIPTFEFKAINGKVEVYSPVVIEAPIPLDSIDLAAFAMTFKLKDDTVWSTPPPDLNLDISRDTLNPRLLKIAYPWNYETQYKIEVDSLAARDIYGTFSDDFKYEFAIRPEAEYAELKFNITGMPDSIPAFVMLLDNSDKPLQALPVAGNSVTFAHLTAGKYNAKIVQDFNGNGKWDPGNFDLGQQPDLAYYYPETIDLKQNWSQELDWDVFAKPVDKMKPGAKKANTTQRR